MYKNIWVGSVLILIFITGWRLFERDLIGDNYHLNNKDDMYIPQSEKGMVDFLRKTIRKDEEFLTLTGEGGWYYFLNKPCPVRFNIIQFALTPDFQQEVIDDFEKKNIKYVLYSNTNGCDQMDGFTNTHRIPLILNYVNKHYHPFKTINQNQLWIKNTLLTTSMVNP